jgi:hypothetical protein
MSFNRSKLVAILTGIVSLLLGIAYLILVQVLDSRGEMVPAPVDLALGKIVLDAVAGIHMMQRLGTPLL